MYVLQYYVRGNGFNPGTWHVRTKGGIPMKYKTLNEAKAAYENLLDKPSYRIAEEYMVVRYKAVK